ncbi:DgyrCDS2307 [Dimorphilus gyrociliatus]|uniref:DgyrCDS2307 n=1 Tax=Dimorphilus gyrociliatus TaxID=2664684 RepID=A0A7I8VBQ0_9ANNE|nr:DgyrCDS2307 [Dimorphilus gyrociliatus]
MDQPLKSKPVLGFFSECDDLNSQSSSDDENQSTTSVKQIDIEKKKGNDNRLPPPTELFSNVKAPSFLRESAKKSVDWDNLSRCIIKQKEGIEITSKASLNNMPPPKSYSSETGKLKPTLGDNSTQQKRRPETIIDDDLEVKRKRKRDSD